MRIRPARAVVALAAAIALGGLPGTVEASGDYGCYADWTIASPTYDCANRAVLSPGNDTRVNLVWLLRDRAGLSAPGRLAYPAPDWDSYNHGHVFFGWDTLQATFWPALARREDAALADGVANGDPTDDFSGRRCASVLPGEAAYLGALDKARGLGAGEREKLVAARKDLVVRCAKGQAPSWPEGIVSAAGKDYLVYLQGADAFYADQFATADDLFGRLAKSSDPWIAETASYMHARNALAAAQNAAIDEWGDFTGGDKVDTGEARNGLQGLGTYLAKWPDGRYATSATGLKRRALWLLRDRTGLSRIYASLLSGLAPDDDATAKLVEEVDNKLLMDSGEKGAIDGPLLLATWDLMRMRSYPADEAEYQPKPIGEAELAAQAQAFAGRADLWSFIQANYAYYLAKDYRRVLQLLPDDARKSAYTPLAFSRQMLRGQALETLGDRNAAGFWKELVGGAHDLYQRPTVELAWAMNRERHGALGEVFAANSIVHEPEIRAILLENSAGPDLLRQAAGSGGSRLEREVAKFTLLTRDLATGRFADFAGDVKLVPASASTDGYIGGWIEAPQAVPLGLFTSGRFSDGYGCPAIVATASALAEKSDDPHALLCLGDFYRLNGFDDYLSRPRPGPDVLGGGAKQFPGTMRTRSALYAAVIANPAATANDRAYALYRAVWCYGPSGINSCGGADVPKDTRKAWFQRLKRDYPDSKWATNLKYYW